MRNKTEQYLDSISERDIAELIHICLFKDEWQPKMVLAVEQELKNRGVSFEQKKQLIKEYKTKIDKELKLENEQNAKESYNYFDLIMMSLFWPRALFSDWNLKKDGFPLLAKQRIKSIVFGLLIYSTFFLYASYNQTVIDVENAIEEDLQTITDSIYYSKINWSGKYIFTESDSFNTTWTLELRKSNNKHSGTLQISNNSKKIDINVDAVVTDTTLDLFPTLAIENKTFGIISKYDKLFSLEIEGKDTITWWQKTHPLNKKNTTGEVNFKKQKQPLH